MNDDTPTETPPIIDHSGARELGLALINGGVKPLVRAEITANPRFAKLIADLMNNSFKYLVPTESAQQVELVAAQSLTLDSVVEFLDLSYTVTQSMKQAGYYTIRDLIMKRPSDVIALRSIGKVSLRDIEVRLRRDGFSLRDEKEPYWDLVKRIYGSIEDAPVSTLFDSEIVRDNPRNRRILGGVDFIGDLSYWKRRRLNTISGNPEDNGRQLLEEFLRKNGLRKDMDAQEEAEKVERFTLISPPVG